MKKRLFILPLLFIAFQIQAQSNKLVKADKAYTNLAYVNAIETYEKVAEQGYKSLDLFQKLGNSYYFNGKLNQANKWYTEMFALNEKVEPEYYYRYSLTLKSVGDYKKANEYLDKFYQMSGKDIRANYYANQKNYLEDIAKNSGRYTVKITDINSKMSDYGTAMYGDKILFSTSRDSVGYSKFTSKWTSQSFTNLYEATKSEDGLLTNPKKFDKSINSRYHEDTPVFTKDLKTVYFTRNNFNNGKIGRDENKIILLKLYKATLVGDKWENVTELPFNSDSYSVAHPALSPDEKTLYFASNMPGSKGQSDLFKVAILEGDKYGTPVNLTGGINTEGRETFPFITSDNELYFASDGHQGLGGLDIFAAKLDQNGMPGPVLNVGEPVNGPMDDFAYIIDKATKKGYFSSNRAGGVGLDDIYSFVETKDLPLDIKVELEVQITDADTKEVMSDATITLSDANFNEIEKVQSDKDGKYNFTKVEPGKKYYIKGEKEGYDTQESSVTMPTVSGKQSVKIAPARKVKEVKVGTDLAKILEINIIYFDLDKFKIRNDASVDLAKVVSVMKQNPTMKVDVRSHTDSRQTAEYNQKLSDNRAKATIDWMVKHGIERSRLTGKGYGESQLVNNCADGVNCSEEEHQQNRRSEFVIISM